MISATVLSALGRTGQLRSNRLGQATGMIFFTCGLGHLAHLISYIAPSLSSGGTTTNLATLLFQCTIGPQATRTLAAGGLPVATADVGWALAGVDAATAAVAVWYLTLRRHYRKLLDPIAPQPQLFQDFSERDRSERLVAERAEALGAATRMSQFLASMNHEIRTPLNGVLGMAELLMTSDLDEDQERFTRTLIESGAHLMLIVDEVLDLARIEAGRVELHVDDFDVHDLLAKVRELYGPRAAGAGIELHVRLDERVPRHVRGDAARLRQILFNLVSNAVKFTAQGAVTVAVSAVEPRGHDDATSAGDGAASPGGERAAAPVTLRFAVSDTGIGIDAAAIPTLFDPFVQADATISSTYGGTGLGLAITRELVALMGGSVVVSSTPGEGTTFSFEIALETATPAAGTADAPTDGTADADAAPGRVLLADDNPINQQVTAVTLRWVGFDVDVVDNGADALRALDRARYVALMLDCEMPRMDGYACARRIRERDDDIAGVPIFALSAAATDSERERCLRAGMDDVLATPLTPTALLDALRRHGLAHDAGVTGASHELERAGADGATTADGPPVSLADA